MWYGCYSRQIVAYTICTDWVCYYYLTNSLNYHRFIKIYLKIFYYYMFRALSANHQGEYLSLVATYCYVIVLCKTQSVNIV
jgi:hypothetical protein